MILAQGFVEIVLTNKCLEHLNVLMCIINQTLLDIICGAKLSLSMLILLFTVIGLISKHSF